MNWYTNTLIHVFLEINSTGYLKCSFINTTRCVCLLIKKIITCKCVTTLIHPTFEYGPTRFNYRRRNLKLATRN